jgi:hypothetical protein
MSRHEEGVVFQVAGKPYVWTRNTDGVLEAVSFARVAEAADLLETVGEAS